MGDDGEPPAKQSKCNNYSEHQMEVPISETTLVYLNVDCLIEMFGHLNVIELCYVSRVCKQLQELAKSYFKSKYRDFGFSTLFQGRLISNEEAKDVLSTFGLMITSISIERETFHNHETGGHVEERILNDVAKYCKEVNTLTLTSFCFTSQAVEALNLLSGSLIELTLIRCVSANCVFHLINFSSLQHLTLTNPADCHTLMDTFPNLKSFTLHKLSVPSQCLLHHFLARHSQLEELKICKCTGVSSIVVTFVAKYVKNLRSFEFCRNSLNPSESREVIKENFYQLSELRNLEYLALKCDDLSIGNLLTKMVGNKISLKTLHILKGLNDAETIDAIVQMKYLEELYLYAMKSLNGKHLIKCAKELPQLKEFTICLLHGITAVTMKEVLRHANQLVLLQIYQRDFRFDSELYNDILNTVKERRNGTKLEISFRSAGFESEVQILVPQRTIHANDNWLTITIKET